MLVPSSVEPGDVCRWETTNPSELYIILSVASATTKYIAFRERRDYGWGSVIEISNERTKGFRVVGKMPYLWDILKELE